MPRDIGKHYSFNNQPVAIRKGGTLRYTHTDHLGSSSGQTDTSGNAIVDSYLRYYAYGGLRSGILSASTTDRTFTGQKQDGTGLTANRRNTRIVGSSARSIRVFLLFAVNAQTDTNLVVICHNQPRHTETRLQRHRRTPLSQPDQQPLPASNPAGRGAGGEGLQHTVLFGNNRIDQQAHLPGVFHNQLGGPLCVPGFRADLHMGGVRVGA